MVQRRNAQADKLGIPRSQFDAKIYRSALERNYDGLSAREFSAIAKRDIEHKEREINGLRYIDHAIQRAQFYLATRRTEPYVNGRDLVKRQRNEWIGNGAETYDPSEPWFSEELKSECDDIEREIIQIGREIRRRFKKEREDKRKQA